MSPHVWFAGLNGLRFLAAITVVLAHMHSNPGSVDLPQWPDFPILFKSHAGVSFFFVLSGFLITYLLLEERIQTGRISVRNFYLRRVFRIWPLYTVIIVFGLIFYWVIVPRTDVELEIKYNLELAILLYTVLLANLMSSLYHVGGILSVTWSIAVEEQFYLVWAPMVKKFFLRRLPTIIASVIIVSATVNILNGLDMFGLTEGLKAFIGTLKFHYMGLGAAAAWMLHYRRDIFLAWPVFTTRAGQAICLTLILAYFFAYPKSAEPFELLLGLPMGFLYAWLIVNTGANPNNAIKLSNRPGRTVGRALDQLGKLSYGIYMYHMIVIYFVSFLFTKVALYEVNLTLYFAAYFALVMVASVTLAWGSYAFLEKRLIATGRHLNRFALEDQISSSAVDLNENKT
jgi:peptidoglycan/LPS O-acetylase OafA/YrhL